MKTGTYRKGSISSRAVVWAVALTIGLASSVASPSVNAIEPDKVKHGLQRGAMGSLKVTLPMTQDKYGLDYDQLIFNDATSVILAMDQGEISIGNVTAQHLIRAIDQDLDLVMVAGWGGGYNVLMAGNTVNLKRDDFEGLKSLITQRKDEGKPIRIGVPTGSQQHMNLIYFLKSVGVDATADVHIMNIPFPSLPRSLEAGEVDFVMSLAPFAAMIMHGDMGSVYHHLYGGERGQWELGFVVPRSLIKQNPGLVQRIVDSHVEAIKMFKDDVSKQVEFEAAEGSFPKPIIEIVQRDFLKHSYRIDTEDIRRVAKMMFELGWTKTDHTQSVDDYIDFTFLERATGENEEQLSHF